MLAQKDEKQMVLYVSVPECSPLFLILVFGLLVRQAGNARRVRREGARVASTTALAAGNK